MLCQFCHQKTATERIKSIINFEQVYLYLCEDCARPFIEGSFFNPLPGFMNAFLQGSDIFLGEKAVQPKKLQCENCGMTFDDFEKSGKVGCHNCYQTFKSQFEHIFESMQGSSMHNGKFPKKNAQAMLKEHLLSDLKQKLQQAIEREEFEKAATLRDEIKEFERGVPNE